MTFVSHAQNFEDVILWRALKHVKNGRYIDIGAWEPEIHSVSKAFYDQGWRGTHVEPVHVYAEKLRLARPDETVIEALVGKGTAPVEFRVFDETGLSTKYPNIAAQHRERGFKDVKVQVVQIPLSQILNDQGNNEIHWLKIDVEGMEDEVIRSWGRAKARPWVLVIESTVPLSPTQSFKAWEPRVLKLGYEFVYFDGLNRFYLHEKHSDLQIAFESGPNVFDDFVLGRHSSTALHHYAKFASDHSIAIEEIKAESISIKQALERNNDILISQNAALSQQLATLQQEKDAAIHHTAVLNENLATLEDGKIKLTNQNSELTVQLAKLENAKNELEEKLNASIHLTAALNENLATLEDGKIKLTNQNSELTVQLAKLENAKNELEERLNASIFRRLANLFR
jgi:FkbM family methyltransferase